MDDRELLRLDYGQTTAIVQALTDVRFKLLALVPTLAGAAVAVLSGDRGASQRLAVGLLGLTATLGVYLYELRNTQVYDAAVQRARVLERELGLRSLTGAGTGGVFSERPPGAVVLGIAVWHDRGLGLVYGAALAGWVYLVGWGAFALAGVPEPDLAGALLGALAGAGVVLATARLRVSAQGPAADSRHDSGTHRSAVPE